MGRDHQQASPGTTVRGTLAQLYLAPGADVGLALVDQGGDIGTPIRIRRSNYEALATSDAIEHGVVAECDGEGLWVLQLDSETA